MPEALELFAERPILLSALSALAWCSRAYLAYLVEIVRASSLPGQIFCVIAEKSPMSFASPTGSAQRPESEEIFIVLTLNYKFFIIVPGG
jgi:hypothetical protein